MTPEMYDHMVTVAVFVPADPPKPKTPKVSVPKGSAA